MTHFYHILTHVVVGSEELYNAVRANFIIQGTTFNKWCLQNNINRSTAEKALKGHRTIRNALALVELAIKSAIPEVLVNG